jgi:hypothetical protein
VRRDCLDSSLLHFIRRTILLHYTAFHSHGVMRHQRDPAACPTNAAGLKFIGKDILLANWRQRSEWGSRATSIRTTVVASSAVGRRSRPRGRSSALLHMTGVTVSVDGYHIARRVV